VCDGYFPKQYTFKLVSITTAKVFVGKISTGKLYYTTHYISRES